MKNFIFYLFVSIAGVGVSAQAIPPYYSSVDFNLSGIALKNELAQLIVSTHDQQLSYNEIWQALKYSDVNPENNNQVLLIYGWPNVNSGTNARTRYKYNNGGAPGDWNREHVYAKAQGEPNLGTSGPGADAHHIRPADVQKNTLRSNLKFASGSGNSGFSGGGWYPGDEWKGDVARMMMYMYLRYGTQCNPKNIGIGSSQNTPDEMVDLFLQWNAEDPVSEFEIQRNNYVGGHSGYYQGNRNPFIDNPFLASKIWGGPLAEDTWGLLDNPSFEQVVFGMYPNPAKEGRTIIASEETIEEIRIFSIDGRLIRWIKNPLFVHYEYEIGGLTPGFYLIQVRAHQKQSTKKLIVR